MRPDGLVPRRRTQKIVSKAEGRLRTFDDVAPGLEALRIAEQTGRDAALVQLIIAVSPLVTGTSLEGPLGKLVGELGLAGDNRTIAEHYAGLIDHLFIDVSDAADGDGLRAAGLDVTLAPTVMRDPASKEQLARRVLAAAGM